MDMKTSFLKFWTSDNAKIVFFRDIFIAFLAVLIVLTLLWGYTGQWFAAPMVAIESGSMEHPDNPPFGRLGTIDAGDMVLVQKVTNHDDLITHGGNYGGAQARNGWQSYGDYGDVVIYKPLGNDNTPQIIHRLMCWVELRIQGNTTTYTIAEYGIFNEDNLDIPDLGINPVTESRSHQPWMNWDHSGYITMGDNNDICDQVTSLCPQPLQLEWITGKARFEIPWLGTINLFFDDILTGGNTVQNVHQDSLICLGIVIALLISIPIILDVKDYLIRRREDNQEWNS